MQHSTLEYIVSSLYSLSKILSSNSNGSVLVLDFYFHYRQSKFTLFLIVYIRRTSGYRSNFYLQQPDRDKNVIVTSCNSDPKLVDWEKTKIS
jgi:hypothetical protein